MVVLVIILDALHDGDAVRNGRLFHGDGLETAFQCRILLDAAAVLVERGGTYDLDLAPGQSRLEDVGRVHAALGIPGSDQVVHLVDDKDHVAFLLDLFHQALHAALELAAELSAGYQGRQVKKMNFLAQQLVGHVPFRDAARQPFRDGRLAHAGLADQAGVVLLSAVQDLDGPFDLFLTADQTVQFSLPGLFRKADGVGVQEFGPFVLAPFCRSGSVRSALFLPGCASRPRRVGTAEQPVHEREGRRAPLVPFVVLAVLRLVGDEMLHAGHGVHHLLGDAVQILVAQVQPFHQILDRPYVQFLGAFQAKAFVGRHAVFHLGHEYDGHVLLTSRTNLRSHKDLPNLLKSVTDPRGLRPGCH